jgi:zinc transport system ATP-binding protein
MDPILSVKNLTVRLDDRTILHDISFDLEQGETLAVIGPNGSGKTVLLKTILGMFPHEGIIERAPDTRIGYVPQRIEADRHLPLNFKNLLAAKADVLKLSAGDVEDTLRAVGVSRDVLLTPVGHLSGGQFQKALLAFALIGKPTLLILDEPTASIDQPREEQLHELVHRLQDERGLAAIHVSHDLSFVYRYATKVLCLNQRGLCFGVPRKVLTPKTLEKLYGAPMSYYHHRHDGGN